MIKVYMLCWFLLNIVFHNKGFIKKYNLLDTKHEKIAVMIGIIIYNLSLYYGVFFFSW